MFLMVINKYEKAISKTIDYWSRVHFLFSYISTFADDLDNSTDLLDVSKELNVLNYVETSSSGTSTLNLNTRSCIVLDRLSKKILYGKNEYNKVKWLQLPK